jgi:Flp pilus assembly protein protease CpaA
MWMDSWNGGDNLLPWLIVTAVALVAAAWDATQHRIPNWLTGSAWAAGLVWAGWVAGPTGIGDSLLGSLVMAVPYVVLFVLAGGGAGDAKLMAALGAWLGFSQGVFALLCIAAAGMIIGLAFAFARRQMHDVAVSLWVLLFDLGLRTIGVRKGLGLSMSDGSATGRTARAFPYGIAILAGTLTASVGAALWPR